MQNLSGNAVFDTLQIEMNSWQKKFAVLVALVFSADWLFFDQKFGISVLIFILLMAVSLLAIEKLNAGKRPIGYEVLILLLGLLPLIEELNTLTFLIGGVSILNFMFSRRTPNHLSLLERASLSLLFILRLPLKLILDAFNFSSIVKRIKIRNSKPSTLRNWTLPLLMSSGFLFLFAIANPLIGNWIQALDLGFILSLINFDRIIFWVLIATICWPFLKPSFQKLQNSLGRFSRKKSNSTSIERVQKGLLDENAVFRSLVLFNVLFAIQTVLDFQYLWIGTSLPEGVTFSQYVHNGTYVLIFTTLLAAGFILFVTGEKKRLEKSPRIMGLLLFWAVQNIILVLSNVMRMELYVEAYALTYLRLGVMIWLAIVVIGLTLIIFRLFKGRSNVWLVKQNFISVGIILYAVSFVNLPYVVADYNLRTAEQSSSKRLDINYIVQLGPNAIPVLDTIIKNPRWSAQSKAKLYWNSTTRQKHALSEIRVLYANRIEQDYLDWRQWNFRDYRLLKSNSQIQATVLPNPLSGL